MINTKAPWIKNLPSEWGLIRFKNIAVSKKTIAREKAKDYERLALTLNGVIKREKDDNEGLQPKEFEGYQILNKNDFVFKMIDLQNISTSRVGLSPFTGLVSPAYLRFEPKAEVNSKYYYYYYMSLYHLHVFNNLAGDGVRSALNAEDLGNIWCPSPSREEQEKIVNHLDAAFKLSDNLLKIEQKQVDLLKALRQAELSEIVLKGLHPESPLKNSEISWIGTIPENWEIARVKNALIEVNNRSETGLEEPLSMSQTLGIVPSSMVQVANPPSSMVGAKIVEVGDLVFNKLKAHLGVFAISKYRGLVSPDYAVYRVKKGFLSEYIEFVFHTPQCISEFKKYITGIGAGLSRLYTPDLFNIYIPKPSLEEQKEMVIKAKKFSESAKNLENYKTELISKILDYQKTLLFEYTTGIRRV